MTQVSSDLKVEDKIKELSLTVFEIHKLVSSFSDNSEGVKEEVNKIKNYTKLLLVLVSVFSGLLQVIKAITDG